MTEMNNYLAVINRYQFAQYYRYGYTYIAKSSILKFDGNITDDVKLNLAAHFQILSPFEFDDEYLILHLTKEAEPAEDNIPFEITDIAAIYPLSTQAKASIEDKIDRRINFQQPIFESVLPLIESNIQKKEIEKAIDALWHVCEMPGDKKEVLDIIGLENIYKGIKYRESGIKAHKIIDGSYWSILIAYDRYEYYPNDIIGFFYDAGQVFAYSKNQPTFEGSGLHKFLTGLNTNLKTPKIKELLEESEVTKNYCTQTTFGDLKGYIVAPLFLMLKDELGKIDDIHSTKLLKFTKDLKNYGKEFNAVLILLGAFFGFKKFYDLYYDKANLRFYKNYSLSKPDISESTTDIKPIEEEVGVERTDIQKEITQVQEVDLNNKMAEKPKKKKKESKKDKEPVTSNNDEIEKLKPLILEIVKERKDVSVTILGKEILKIQKVKKSNTILENIIKEMPSEIELYHEKKVAKVRTKTAELFDTKTE